MHRTMERKDPKRSREFFRFAQHTYESRETKESSFTARLLDTDHNLSSCSTSKMASIGIVFQSCRLVENLRKEFPLG